MCVYYLAMEVYLTLHITIHIPDRQNQTDILWFKSFQCTGIILNFGYGNKGKIFRNPRADQHRML